MCFHICTYFGAIVCATTTTSNNIRSLRRHHEPWLACPIACPLFSHRLSRYVSLSLSLSLYTSPPIAFLAKGSFFKNIRHLSSAGAQSSQVPPSSPEGFSAAVSCYTYMHEHVCVCVCVCVCVGVSVFIHIHVYLCVYICIQIDMCIYI